MATATLELRVYKPEQLDGPATVNRVKLGDYVSYSSPLPDGLYFAVLRDGNHANPRTLVLSGAQLATLDKRPTLARRAA